MDDLISRQAALEMLNDNELERQADDVFDGDLHRYKRAAQRIIAQLPSAEKNGKWETKPFIDPNDPMKDTGAVWCRCSECKTKLGVFQDGNFFDYCPNCGAKMGRSEDV